MSGRLVPAVIGVAMAAAGLLRRDCASKSKEAAPEEAAARLEGATQARLTLKHGAGMLTLGYDEAEHRASIEFDGASRRHRRRTRDPHAGLADGAHFRLPFSQSCGR